MRLSYLQFGLITLMKSCSALGNSEASESSESGSIQQESIQRANFDINYETLEQGAGSLASFLEFEDGDNVTLRYSLFNKEDVNVSVVAVGGALYDIHTNELAANISAAALGPIPVGVNETVEFQQIVNLILKEGEYALSPDIYIEKSEETMKVVANPNLLRILPAAISFFNPQFMFVQFVLAALIAGFSYLTFFKTPKAGTRDAKKIRKSGVSSPQDITSWLPENHTKK
ncbi:LANO_0H19438g1_1 [Lachancea nothofagi CBS 11611]|uniref:Increased recombination centers protein 22 n=1 Tax=Lachancea nothofagi CBS 11611 TaxID=1266666 RepID=A0A1G4KN72_9SACH|nr:LANO_0H19438g1_1 [Lachancea nothofagi CBS 11611]